MTGGGPLVELAHASCRYDGDDVLIDIDLAVRAGSFVGIVGPSGSGKSTLLKALCGTVTPYHGHVHRTSGLRVGYVPQVETVDWNFPVTVAEVLLMARRNERRLPWRSPSETRLVEATLDRLGIGGLGRRHIRELSGGQQQRVFLARALVSDPQLLLMDEPTSGVDVKTRHEILHLLSDLNAQGVTMVLTTHDLNGLAAHLPHLVCLNRRVVAEGSPCEVIRPDVLEQTYGARMEVLVHAGLPVVIDQPPREPVGARS